MHFVDPQNTTRKRELPLQNEFIISTDPLAEKVAPLAKKISIPVSDVVKISGTTASTPSDLPSDQVLTTTTTAQQIIAPSVKTSDPAKTVDNLQLGPRNADTKMSGAIVRAKYLIEQNQFNLALSILDTATSYIGKMKQTDLKLDYFTLRGECSMNSRDHAHAIANYFLATTLEQNSEKKDQFLSKIRTCFQEGMNDAQKLHGQSDLQGALTKLSTLVGAFNIKTIPNDVKFAYFMLQGNCFYKLGNHLSAIDSFYKAEANEESSEIKAELLYKIAHSFQASNRPLNAFQVIDAALEIPNLKDSLKEQFLALKIKTTLIKAMPKSFADKDLAMAFLEEGQAKLKSGNCEGAIVCLGQGINIAGHNPELKAKLYFQLGWAYYMQNQFSNSILSWESCCQFVIDEKYKAMLVQHIANACVQNKEIGKAEKILQNAIAVGFLNDTTGGIILCLLDLIEHRNQPDMNERICDLLLKILLKVNSFSDKMKGMLCIRLARAQLNSGNYKVAIATCTSGLLLKIDDAMTTKLLHCQVASHMRLQLLQARLSKAT